VCPAAAADTHSKRSSANMESIDGDRAKKRCNNSVYRCIYFENYIVVAQTSSRIQHPSQPTMNPSQAYADSCQPRVQATLEMSLFVCSGTGETIFAYLAPWSIE